MPVIIEVKVQAKCQFSEDIAKICSNFFDEYSSFADFREYKLEKTKDTFSAVWKGETESLLDENRNELIRLTHHAEGLYEGTSLEYVHVEVCIDGVWYG